MPHSKLLIATFVLSLVVCVVGVSAQSPAVHPPSPPPPPVADQEVFIAYWTSETGWGSELQLRNNALAQPLTVTPVLRSADGVETNLAPVTIQSEEVVSVDINAAIAAAAAPQLVGTYGSVALRFRAASASALYAAVMIHNMGHPIAFHIDAASESQDIQIGSREGIWWLPDDSVSDYLILANQGKNTLSLNLSLSDASGKQASQQVLLGSAETSRLSIRKLIRAAGLTGSYGGIKISTSSHAGSLDSLHFLFAETSGFSATLKMFDYNPNAAITERDYAHTGVWTLRAPMLALSTPDPALALPPGTTLQPELFVRNTTPKTLTAKLRFNWRNPTETGAALGPSLTLNPYETRRIDVAALQAGGTLPKDANWASVTLTTQGQPDELMAVAASYDKTLQYGAQTPFSDQLSFRWEGGMWQYDAYHDSIITVGNGGTKPTQTAFTIFYNEGTQRYDLEQTLQPDAQMWIDIGKLISEHVPDKNGNLLPPGVNSGSYEFRDRTDTGVGSLFEGKLTYDKTYGHAVYGCAECCAYGETVPWYVPIDVVILTEVQNGVNGLDSCTGKMVDVSQTFYNNWSSANTAIVTVDKYGNHTGKAAGSTTTETSGSLPKPAARLCPALLRNPSGGADVVPPSATITITFANVAKSEGDNLSFPSTNCSQNLGLKDCPSSTAPGWYWNVEVSALVTDDASKWTIAQTLDGARAKGNYKDANGVLHAYDTTSTPGPDGPLSGFFQQTAGTKTIYYIDAPGPFRSFLPGETNDSVTMVKNFTAHFCSTVVADDCFTKQWFIKIIVNPGAVLDTVNSTASYGTTSLSF